MSKTLKKAFIIIMMIWGSLIARGRISGYMFGDYYYVIQTHHPDSLGYKGQNGFWLRRIYFTYDHEISENFSTRLRMEYASNDFTKSSSRLFPFVKDAYLKWKIKEHSLIIGISPTPTWEKIEKIWGYRSLEKTPLDLQKFGSSRDFGIAMKGYIDSGKKLNYHIMFANGEGNKSENNKQKKIMGSLGLNLKPFYIEFYTDWKEGKGYTDIYTFQGFVSFRNEKFRTGLQYAIQKRENEPDTVLSYEIASLFFVINLNKKLSFIFRYDKTFDPNPEGERISYIPMSESAPSNLIIAGVDLKLHEYVSLIPNIEYVFYDEENGYRPLSDIYLRLTFFYKFK